MPPEDLAAPQPPPKKKRGRPYNSLHEKSRAYHWLLHLKDDSTQSPNAASRMSWLAFLAQKNMGTKGIVSFYQPPPMMRSGCFCTLKTSRTMEMMLENIGSTCTVEKLSSRFSSQHPLYLELGARFVLHWRPKG